MQIDPYHQKGSARDIRQSIEFSLMFLLGTIEGFIHLLVGALKLLMKVHQPEPIPVRVRKQDPREVPRHRSGLEDR